MRTSILSKITRYNNLTQRLITALAGAIVIITGIVWSEWTYFIIFFFICLSTILEFYNLVGLDGKLPLKTFGSICGLSLFCLTFLIDTNIVGPRWFYLVFPLMSGVFLIKLYKKSDEKPFTNIAFTFLGILYVAVPFSLLNMVAFGIGHYSYQIILGTLLILWASDTGAYFAGINFGRTKLFERISPKKSWEGSVGGTFLAFAMAFGISLYFKDLLQWQWFAISAIIVIVGTYGDLVESLFKRSMLVKDSSTVIPGHGGFLDRFDSLLLASPFISAFLEIFRF